MVMGFIERVSERQVRRYITKEADDKIVYMLLL